MTKVILLFTDRDHVRLMVDGVEYEYETSYYHVEKVRAIYSKSPLRALNHIKKFSSSVRKTGRVESQITV